MTVVIVPVEVWICPTKGCGNFFGSKAEMGKDLNAILNEMRVDDKKAHVAQGGSPFTHSRGECPDCRARGKKVPRVKVVHAFTLNVADEPVDNAAAA